MPLAAGIASFALCYAGLSGVCLAMDRHHRQVWQRSSSVSRSRLLRVGGWLLLALSLAACIRTSGFSVGAVLWFGVLSATSLLIVVLLPSAPRAFARCAAVAAPAGLLLLAVAVYM